MTEPRYIKDAPLALRAAERDRRRKMGEQVTQWGTDTTPAPIGADAALAQLVAAVEAETDPGWNCNSYHPSLWSALDVARAVLASAAQPEATSARATENVSLLADILNRRPAMNAGLAEAYAHWTAEVYDLMGAIAAEPANDAAAPKAAPAPAAQGDALDAAYQARWDAELGRTAMRFVDRAGDVHPGVDDAETICAEFHAAMSAVIERMPHVQRMNAANEDARAAARAAKEGGKT